MIIDISAFLPPSPEGGSGSEALPPQGEEGLLVGVDDEGDALDADGCLIPVQWRPIRDRWMRLALEVRRKLSDSDRQRQARLAEKAAKKAKRKPRTTSSTPFTTQYAIDWGRRQGWKLIDRERYDFRNKRHHDLQLAVDALFDDGGDGMVGVQGAGLYEREDHFRKFQERGGEELARRRHIRIIYLEFVRGNPDPITEERWVA